MAVVLAIVGAVLVGVVSNELFAWLRLTAQALVRFAARRFRDPLLGQRFSEEWEAAVADIPGGLIALIHAVTLVACVRRIERSWAAETTESDVDERFDELAQTVCEFTESFATALAARGLSLEDVARVTKVSINDLRALLDGNLSRIRLGYLAIFLYMNDLSDMLGTDFPEIKARYAAVLLKSGGLPPAPKATRSDGFMRLWCSIRGHRASKHHIHGGTQTRFHWSYRRCSRCGDVSIMRAQPCKGTKIKAKLEIDAPVTERFSCDYDDGVVYSSLDSGPQFVVGESVAMTKDRIKELSE